MSFPTGVPRVTVTGQNLVDDGGGPLQGVVVFDAGQLEFAAGATPPTVFDTPVVAEVASGVMTPVTLPDSKHAFASVFTYTVTVRFEGRTDAVYPGIIISLDNYPSGTVDLAQLL